MEELAYFLKAIFVVLSLPTRTILLLESKYVLEAVILQLSMFMFPSVVHQMLILILPLLHMRCGENFCFDALHISAINQFYQNVIKATIPSSSQAINYKVFLIGTT